MNILIVGGRDTTEYLLNSLSNKSHNITFIHDDYDYCKNISRKYDVTVICGDGSKPYILEEAKINFIYCCNLFNHICYNISCAYGCIYT